MTNEIKEVNLEEAFEIVNKKQTKFIWLGSESINQIATILNSEQDKIIQLNPMDLMNSDQKEFLSTLEGHVLVCYRGRTSKMVAQVLKSKHNIESFSLKGGITNIK